MKHLIFPNFLLFIIIDLLFIMYYLICIIYYLIICERSEVIIIFDSAHRWVGTAALLLLHPAVHGRDSEVRLPHLARQPVHLLLGVAEDHRLRGNEEVRL